MINDKSKMETHAMNFTPTATKNTNQPGKHRKTKVTFVRKNRKLVSDEITSSNGIKELWSFKYQNGSFLI